MINFTNRFIILFLSMLAEPHFKRCSHITLFTCISHLCILGNDGM
jgi:hypothetical protein